MLIHEFQILLGHGYDQVCGELSKNLLSWAYRFVLQLIQFFLFIRWIFDNFFILIFRLYDHISNAFHFQW